MPASTGEARSTEANSTATETTTATETASASNWSSPAASADGMATTAEASSHSSSAAVRAATLGLPDQCRAREQRDPIEFSFHDFNFLSLCVVVF